MSPVGETRVEAPNVQRKRVPRPAVEWSTERPRISARVPESPTRRHRVARAIPQSPPASPMEPVDTPAQVSPRRRPPRASEQSQAPEQRKAPPFQDAFSPRPRDRTVRPDAVTAKAPTPRAEEFVPTPAGDTRRPTPGPVHIEVKTLLPPPRVEAPPQQETPDEEPLWGETPPEYEVETSDRPFFMNGRRITAQDVKALQQAEQRLRRRMTGRALWRRRG